MTFKLTKKHLSERSKVKININKPMQGREPEAKAIYSDNALFFFYFGSTCTCVHIIHVDTQQLIREPYAM